MKSHHLSLALALGAVTALPAPAATQATDRELLSAFCDAANIQGKACKRANNYPNAGRRTCDVKLTGSRYSGRFLSGGNPILIASYDSGCEAHVNEFGGSVLFEQAGGRWSFTGFQPGYRVNECIVLPKGAQQDLLVCLTGHMGQGHLESGVAQMAFRRDSSNGIALSLDFLMTAEDDTGAYGANTVDCKEPSKYFGLSRLAAGPRPETVSVDVAHADGDTIRTACGKGFPRPKQVFGELAAGEAYVPAGYEKKSPFVIDLTTRKVDPIR